MQKYAINIMKAEEYLDVYVCTCTYTHSIHVSTCISPVINAYTVVVEGMGSASGKQVEHRTAVGVPSVLEGNSIHCTSRPTTYKHVWQVPQAS